MSKLSLTSLEQLLLRLSADPSEAAEQYERLRSKLVKCLHWKGCPESRADALADAAIDRLALKIEQGEVVENVDAYACTILRFVYLEYVRSGEGRTDGEVPDQPIGPEIPVLRDEDDRMNCLRKCLVEVVPDMTDRAIIVGYYDNDPGLKNKEQRKKLAERLGMTVNNLKVKACRIRDRLEKCINECMRQEPVTKTA